MTALKNFRANLAYALANRDLSYRVFAGMSELTYIYIYRIVNPDDKGKPEPSLEVCDRIAMALGYQLSNMLADPKDFKKIEKRLTTAV